MKASDTILQGGLFLSTFLAVLICVTTAATLLLRAIEYGDVCLLFSTYLVYWSSRPIIYEHTALIVAISGEHVERLS